MLTCCGMVPVVAWSPDLATGPDRRSPCQRRPAVGLRGLVWTPCHNGECGCSWTLRTAMLPQVRGCICPALETILLCRNACRRLRFRQNKVKKLSARSIAMKIVVLDGHTLAADGNSWDGLLPLGEV